jgi:hypothetical protein
LACRGRFLRPSYWTWHLDYLLPSRSRSTIKSCSSAIAKGAKTFHSHLRSGSCIDRLGGLGFSIGRYIAIPRNEGTEGVWDEASARILPLSSLLPTPKKDAWNVGVFEFLGGGISSSEGFGQVKPFVMDSCAVGPKYSIA